MLLAVLFLTACERSEPYGSACNTETGECEEYDSREEMLAAAKKDHLRRKQLAMRLFVDYREPVFAVLKKYLGNYRDPKRGHRIFVSIFDENIDPTLAARLGEAKIFVEPGWGCDPSGGAQAAALDIGVDMICISIPEVRSIGGAKYQFDLYHFESVSIDHISSASVIVQAQGDKWEILELTPR